MSATPAAIKDALARLRDAGALLRRRSAGDVLEVLGAVLDALAAPDSPSRLLLEGSLPEPTGFTKEVVCAGLALGLAGWDAASLHALVAAELGGPATRSVTGFDVSSVLLGGALPGPTVLALLAPLVLRSAVLAKTSQHDPVTAPIVARLLSQQDPGLGACLEVCSFPGNDAACIEAFVEADCVVATGSDETLLELAPRVRPPRRFVGYGHRVSVAVLGPAALSGEALQRAARGLALDVALWDQLGCLSPVSVFVTGSAYAAAQAIAAQLESLAVTLPRGRIAAADAASLAQARSEAEMRAAAGGRVRVHTDPRGAWTVVAEADAKLRSAPLHRFLRVQPVRDVDQLLGALHPLAPHLAGIALAGFGGAAGEVALALAGLGASRICEPGRLQAPPLAWRHDGQGVLLPLARFTDVEIA